MKKIIAICLVCFFSSTNSYASVKSADVGLNTQSQSVVKPGNGIGF